MAYQTNGKKKQLPAANKGPASADAAPSKSSGLRSAFGGLGSYGQNGAEHAASVVGNLTSKLSDNLRATGDNGALDSVESKGIALADGMDWQTRKLTGSNVPDAFGHASPARGPMIPAKLGAKVSKPVRQP